MTLPIVGPLIRTVVSAGSALLQGAFNPNVPPPELLYSADPLGREWVLWPDQSEDAVALRYFDDPNFAWSRPTLDYPGTSGIRLTRVPWDEASQLDRDRIPLIQSAPPTYVSYGGESPGAP